jgi:pyruvate kinase
MPVSFDIAADLEVTLKDAAAAAGLEADAFRPEVRTAELFRAILTLMLQLELVDKGDMVIVTKGELAGITGGTNALTILRVPQD